MTRVNLLVRQGLNTHRYSPTRLACDRPAAQGPFPLPRPALPAQPRYVGTQPQGTARVPAAKTGVIARSRAHSKIGILVATGVALLAGGLMWWMGMDGAANTAWAAAGVLPLIRLVSGMISELRQGRTGVDVIALLAVIGALSLGEYLTAGIIGLMLASGQYLDEYAAGRAERELTSLLERAPRTAHLLRDGDVVPVDVDDVVVGDRLLITGREVVPVDGIVVIGPALLDESALTGEPLPVERPNGDLVSSGVVNAAGSFEIQAVATAAASTYEGIIRLVRSARESRAPVVRLADRWAAWFVPLTLVISLAAWALSGDPVRGLAVLVVATPCPLLLAVPIAIVSGVSQAARRGIIFRGGAPLETLANAESVVLDKTGTLTVGEPRLRSVTCFAGDVDEDEALRMAASVDQASSHVLARAIVAEARRRRLDLDLPHEVAEQAGDGIVGRVGERRIAVGRASWILEGRKEPEAVADFRRRMARIAPLTVFIGLDGEVVAAAMFDDAIRSDAAAAIRAMRRAGINRVIMATGDHPVVAQSVGLALGIDEIHAETTPLEKVETVRLLRQHGTTVMVGDGINDAPALAAADVGVAMGVRGATASSETADVVLMVDRLQRLVDAICIAKRSRRIAVQSVMIGMGLSLMAMGFAAFGVLAPIAGAITQEVIDVIAIGNALRALTGDSKRERERELSPELAAKLKTEHDHLMPQIDILRDTADRVDRLPPANARDELIAVRTFLTEEILPHEQEDEQEVYPQIAAALDGDDPLASMSRGHREIFHLIDTYRRVIDDLPQTGPKPADLRDVRRLLYGLHAVLRLHFDQEEELYSALDETYADAADHIHTAPDGKPSKLP